MRDTRRVWLWSVVICAVLILVYTAACAPMPKPGETSYKASTLTTSVLGYPEVFDDTKRGVVCYLWGSQLSCVKYKDVPNG